jgi:preprotein translocase subunit SecD
MNKNKTYTIIIIIFILAFFAGNFVYPFYKIPAIGGYLNFLKFIPENSFKLGLDLQGGTHLVYEADLSNIAQENKSQSMEGLRDVIERRVNYFGVAEPVVQVQGQRLIVELAGIIDPAEAIRQIGKTPFLEFREEKENYAEILENNKKVLETGEGQFEEPFKPTPLTGKYLKGAEIGSDQTTFQSLVLLEFNEEGAKIFEELTSKNVGKPLAIYIDGILISAPVVQEVISGGKAQISGKFTLNEAKDLASNLNAGALPVPIKLISQQSVGPTLGKISLEESLKAGALGFMAILCFMIIFYRIPGFFASISLMIYVVLLLSLFKLIPVTLTLAGIAGFLLSMGMAVDANILIFSRFREELKIGKDYLNALEEGSRRAWPAIRDGNLTTILVGLILFGFGSSFVKGFAFTLIIGNLVGMFTAIVITNNFLRVFAGNKIGKIKWLW